MAADGAAPIRAKIKEIVPEYVFQEERALLNRAKILAEGHFTKAAGTD
jgi:hypothetical protein